MNNPEFAKVGDKKYKINTDFRVAIKCNEIAKDDSISDYERALAIIYKLFGKEGLDHPEDYEQLLEKAQIFLSCNKPIEDIDKEPDMDYSKDMDYIETSFMSDYHISLSQEKMHWWKFYNLINGLSNSELGNCCILNTIRNLRNFDETQIKDDKRRQEIKKAKERVALNKKEVILTDEQENERNELLRKLGLRR